MAPANVQMLGENSGTATFAQGLAFIERTRRQLARFDALPHSPEQAIDPQSVAEIRRKCDDLESDIRKSLSGS